MAVMRFRALTRTYRVLGFLRGTAGFVAAIVGASLKADVAKVEIQFGDAAGTALAWVQQNAWWMIPLALLTLPLIEWARRRIGDPKMWAIVHDVLDQFRERIFQNAATDPLHHHRVTLFKHLPWCWSLRRWPWSGWLKPVERSGHTTQKSRTVFRAPDEAHKIEGVAGETWARRKPVSVNNLPDLRGATPTEAEQADYARRSFISLDAVQRMNPAGRSFHGIPVEANGQLWGVIVVDSRNPAMNISAIKRDYKLIARFLGKLLERI